MTLYQLLLDALKDGDTYRTEPIHPIERHANTLGDLKIECQGTGIDIIFDETGEKLLAILNWDNEY